jgi:hypothetical protein
MMGVMPPSPNALPDYHFLLISPNLGGEWLFDAARLYWERYRPIIVSDLELVRVIPANVNTIVTVIARRDTIAQWGVTFAQVVPHVLLDPLVFDRFDQMKAALAQRAQTNQPFGQPLNPTPPPPTPITPTQGPLIGQAPVIPPTRAPGGFITATPTPGGVPPTQPPQPTGLPETPQGPLFPTPGPVTGG